MENLIYKEPGAIGQFTPEEEEALHLVLEELRAWDTHDLDRLLSVMDEHVVYHDITLSPAKGHQGLREFGEGWLKAAPDFGVLVEKFIVRDNCVVNMGRISGTISGEYFGKPGPNKPFNCMYAQVCVIDKGKIKYVRDHWDSVTMMRQVGWMK